MPTASTKLRKFAENQFGSLDSHGPMKALELKGFTLTKDSCWRRTSPPNGYEWDCINFLIQEWDFGGYDED